MKNTAKSAIAVLGTVGVLYCGTYLNEPQVVGEPRARGWPNLRAKHLQVHPECLACGQRDRLQVHHVVPFSVDPSKEMDPENLVTLCTDGPGNCNCHLIFGHLGDFRSRGNPNVRRDAARFREMLKSVKFD